MRESIRLKGRLSDSRHIELTEPVEGVGEEVELNLLIVLNSMAELETKDSISRAIFVDRVREI